MNNRIKPILVLGLVGVLLFGVLPVFGATKSTSTLQRAKSAVTKVLPKVPTKTVPKPPAKEWVQTVESVKAGGGTSGVKIAPGYWTNEDEIVQLYSLKIVGISNNTIKVSTDRIYPCLRAEDLKKMMGEDPKRELVGPCPTVQEILDIKISKETILLLRNRSRASISDFAVGEQINVYGFQNKDSIEALIVRNMDKPELIQPVELWNMEITQIKDGELTVQYNYQCKGLICPMGAVEPDRPVDSKMMPMIYPMPRVIKINSKTTFSDRNGNNIQFGDLKVGDILNLSGTVRGRDPNAPVSATKVQNTSIPRNSNNLSIQSFSGSGKLQVGQMGEWKIVVSGGNQNNFSYQIIWGDEIKSGIGSGVSAPEVQKDFVNTGVFSHAYQNPGTYTLTIVVMDANGASAKASTQVYVF